MDAEMDFRQLIHSIAEGLTSENVKMIRYLCKDAIPHGMDFPNAITFFEYFETKGWINFQEMSFLAEVLYRINRHDLLKRLPGVKNRHDYEENFLASQQHNFTPFRIACFKLHDELTEDDFRTMKNFCRDKMSNRNYQKSNDILTLLVVLEEEDLISEGDLEFFLSSLRHLDNQEPFKIFQRLSVGDTSITLPKRHQSLSRFPSDNYSQQKAYLNPPQSQSMPQFPHYSGYTGDPNYSPHNPNYLQQKPYSGMPQYPGYCFQGQLRSVENPHNFQQNYDGETTQKARYYPSDDNVNRTFSETYDQVNPQKTAGLYQVDLPPSSLGVPDTQLNTETRGLLFQPEQDVDDATNVKQPETMRLEVAPVEHMADILDVDNAMESLGISQPSEICQSMRSATDNSLYEEAHSRASYHEETTAKDHSESLIGDSQESERMPLESYSMDRNPRGMCLIINNHTFEGAVNSEDAERRLALPGTDYGTPNVGLKNRVGSEKDADAFSKLFKSFGFVVHSYNDLTAREMERVVADYCQMDHSAYDCFVAAVMSHGLAGVVYGVDGMPVKVTKISKSFRPENCPTLVDKPKLFFFQACQGDNRMGGHSAPVADIESDSAQPELPYSTPSEADFLIGHSTVPGYLSYRSRSDGSWFIETLVKNLSKYHSTEDLLSIMIKVNSEVANRPLKQMSMPIATLRKKVYFKRTATNDL